MIITEKVNRLLDKAEALATEAENIIKNKPESITNLTIALNEYRMAQLQALQEVNDILTDMNVMEKEYERAVKEAEKKELDKQSKSGTLNKDNKKLH